MDLQTTSWDNSKIYTGLDDARIQRDLQAVADASGDLAARVARLSGGIQTLSAKTAAELQETLEPARTAYRLALDTQVTLFTLAVFASSTLSVDALDVKAKDLQSRVNQATANLQKALKPLEVFLLRAPGEYLETFLQDPRVSEMAFSLRSRKKEEDFLLSPEAEVLLEGHSVDGLHAWADMYTALAGALKVEVGGETMGLAQAANLLFGPDRNRREQAHHGINRAWAQYEIPAAAVLNSINGWRLENYRARSGRRELHYLDKSCQQARITRETLNTLMQVTFERREIGQKALRLMARELKLEKLGPWDVLAPYPAAGDQAGSRISFPEAMELIIRAFGGFSADMADFARLMWKNNWIDATPTPNRGAGAYCTRFASVREPRVFITFEGNMKNVITLAHELGHAYHNWVMRDLKLGEVHYPMTLAETASIFAETLVREDILARAANPEEKKRILWQDVESAATLLINIPARFEMEKRLVELRRTRAAGVEELKQLTRDSWRMWYGDTLSEYHDMFWATKLHFSMSRIGFYNYPYLFGYLFSLGIYAQKEKLGAGFRDLYVNVLRDTGRMTAEDLVQKHFGADITRPEFWHHSLDLVEKPLRTYEKLQA